MGCGPVWWLEVGVVWPAILEAVGSKIFTIYVCLERDWQKGCVWD